MYVSAAKEIKRGMIASVLDLAGDTTVPRNRMSSSSLANLDVMNTARCCSE